MTQQHNHSGSSLPHHRLRVYGKALELLAAVDVGGAREVRRPPGRIVLARIHITGASGTGTTTLGRAISRRVNGTHFDTDDYFWEPSDPPYLHPRQEGDRIRLLTSDLDAHSRWILSGALGTWADPILQRIQLVIFLQARTEVRLARLRRREIDRFGLAAIEPGGRMHEIHRAFMAWASQYDGGDETMRSLRFHERWLACLSCPVLRLDGELPTEELTAMVLAHAGHVDMFRLPPRLH